MSRGMGRPNSYINPLKLKRAFGDEKTSRRVHARYPCRVTVTVHSKTGRRVGFGYFTNVGLGGALFEGDLDLEKDTDYLFQLGGQGGLAIAGKVARAPAKPGAFGIHFSLTPAQEKRLKAALDKLRQAQVKDPVPDEKMTWYWWL